MSLLVVLCQALIAFAVYAGLVTFTGASTTVAALLAGVVALGGRSGAA